MATLTNKKMDEHKKVTAVVEEFGGDSLIDIVNRKSLSPRDVQQITKQLLGAVGFLHQCRIAHNVSPD